jgi:hypothetical protein
MNAHKEKPLRPVLDSNGNPTDLLSKNLIVQLDDTRYRLFLNGRKTPGLSVIINRKSLPYVAPFAWWPGEVYPGNFLVLGHKPNPKDPSRQVSLYLHTMCVDGESGRIEQHPTASTIAHKRVPTAPIQTPDPAAKVSQKPVWDVQQALVALSLKVDALSARVDALSR